jgi:16S rRNA (guanine527-N7)-methyltransferase
MTLEQLIRSGLQALAFECSYRDEYLDYLLCLERWNRTYNLTAIRDPAQMVSQHLLDSLSIVPLIDGQRIIDVGSGAGLPGIPLALHFPERQFTLLDSNGKKTRFLTQARISLGLQNLTVIQSRLEDWRQQYDQVLCRALAPLDELADQCAHLVARSGNLIAMKSHSEALSGSHRLRIRDATPLRVPMLDAQRWAIRLEPGEVTAA